MTAAAIAAGNTVPVQVKGAEGLGGKEEQNLYGEELSQGLKGAFYKASPSEPEEEKTEKPEEEKPEKPEEEKPEPGEEEEKPDPELEQESDPGEKQEEDDTGNMKQEETEEAEEEQEELPELFSSATGDLWEEWQGAKMDW